MRRAKTTHHHSNLDPDNFLRSINIRLDSEHPERILHFRPTTKSVAFLKALAGFENDKAFFVIAPYGSGKSIAATYLLHLIENRKQSHPVLKQIERRLYRSRFDFEKFARGRRKKEHLHGIVVALHGYCPSLAQSIKASLIESMLRIKLGREARPLADMPCNNIEQLIQFLAAAREKAQQTEKIDRIVIIWDEFGRHLESLISEGHPTALTEIQTLAELVARPRYIPMTFGLLLHQGLFQYAGNMPQSVRTEWKKIEGRFNILQYIDDSKEVYKLVSDVIATRSSIKYLDDKLILQAIRECKRHNIFKDFSDDDLKDLLSRAYPLEPATLYLLPRLSARVAQNERTLFNFIYNVPLEKHISPEDLYDYFSITMQSDVTVGGTYRRWIETQSALSKVGEDKNSAKALKIACLLGLGTSGERVRVSRDLLQFALQGYDRNGSEEVIESLVKRKLLLYRRHSNEVSIWHGTDFDLRSKLEDEKNKWRGRFDLIKFLSKEARPPTWRPIQYNDEFKIRRYLEGEYHNLATLQGYLGFQLTLNNIPGGCDGKVLYVIPHNNEESEKAKNLVIDQLKHDRVFVALPREPIPIFESALEVWALQQMQIDKNLAESDPLVIPELQQMLDDARSHLQKLLNRLVLPSVNGPAWYYRGEEHTLTSYRQLQNFISMIMREVYHLTPRINNEMVVRNKPSPAVAAGRRKLLLGILERSGKPNLGIEGNFPDASLLRTVLLNTGIYREGNNGHWMYESPENIVDPGLRAVWGEFRKLFTQPDKEPKNLAIFFDELRRPPYGLRQGLFPILFAAGLKAFPNAITLLKNSEYINDLLPSEIEQLCREPSLYSLTVPELNEYEISYLNDLYNCFSSGQDEKLNNSDLIRRCFESIEEWRAALPNSSLNTRKISEKALKFQTAINKETDPIALLFSKIPTACGFSIERGHVH